MNSNIIRSSKAHEYMGLCRTAFWKIAKSDEFPRSIELGARARGYFREDIDEWLQSRRQLSPTLETKIREA